MKRRKTLSVCVRTVERRCASLANGLRSTESDLKSERKSVRARTEKPDCLRTVSTDKDYLRAAKIAQQVSRPSTFTVLSVCSVIKLAYSLSTQRWLTAYRSQFAPHCPALSHLADDSKFGVRACSYPHAAVHFPETIAA